MKNNKRYFLIITLGVLFVFGFNLLFYFSLETILFCLISFAIVVVPCVIVMFMIRYFPQKWFEPNRKIFHVFKFESKLYEWINIRKWKNKLPEPGKALFRFDKSKIKNAKDQEYLMLFLYENCRGSSCHFFCFVWGFLSLPLIALILPHPFIFTAGLLIATLHGIIHLASLITLRYMRPRLMKLYQMNKEQVEKHGNITQNTQNIEDKQDDAKNKKQLTSIEEKNQSKKTKKTKKIASKKITNKSQIIA